MSATSNATTILSASKIDTGDTAWSAVSCTYMMLMTPAVGILYGGLLRQKNLLTLLVQSMAIFSVTTITWSLLGYSLAFGTSKGGFIGGSNYFGFQDVGYVPMSQAPTIPGVLFFFYQLCACAVTPAIAVGSAGERFSIIPSLIFTFVWILTVYCPVTHWLWGYGWLNTLGAIDYAGGAVVHMAAGYTSLALSLAIGKRNESADKPVPHNNSYAFLGITLLWFGWFGFNGGSAFAANYQASLAIVSSNISAAAASLSWTLTDYIFDKKIHLMSFVLGAGSGLISITPGSGYCSLWASSIIGLIGGIFSALFTRFKEHYKLYDDAADVFSAHGVCGTWGVFAVGLWAKATEDGVDGGFYGRGIQLGYQMATIITVGPYCFVLSYVIASVMKHLGWLRVGAEEEELGLDRIYGEYGYTIVTANQNPQTEGDQTPKKDPDPSSARKALNSEVNVPLEKKDAERREANNNQL